MPILCHLAAFACSLLAVAALADPAPLSGTVAGKAGTPLAGARVVVWTGDAINDVPLLCPSCYADCGRSETTDKTGSFTLAGMDDEVAFRLVIVAEGHHPLHTQYVTPGEEARTFTLRPREPVADPARLIRGRVVDAQGRPVADAMVNPQLWWFDSARRGGSHLEGSDPFAFTGDDGRFELAAGKPVHGASLRIEGPVLAPTFENLVRSELKPQDQPDITLHTGVTINGRLVGVDGEPLPGVVLNLQSVNRFGGQYYGPVTYGTDDSGQFSFQNVPAHTEVEVFGGMVELKGHGVPTPTTLTTGDNDTTTEVGEIHLERGYTIRGRVVASDGKPLPKDGRKANVFLRGDSQRVDIDDDGSFVFENVPTGEVGVSIQMPGYHVSRWNPNRDQVNRGLRGVVSGDIDDYVVLLEPGREARQLVSHEFRKGERRPKLRGMAEPLPGVIGGRLRAVAIDPRATDAEGWKDFPWHAGVLLPQDTSKEKPRTISLTMHDPARPYLPAFERTIEATREYVDFQWPVEFVDARVLRLDISDGTHRDDMLVDRSNWIFGRLVLHDSQQAGDIHVAAGRVIDMQGVPVAGARVIPKAFWKGNSGRTPWPGGTRLTHTDDLGHFAISASEGFDRAQVLVIAPTHAAHVFDVVPDAPRRDCSLPQPVELTLVAHTRGGEPAAYASATLWRQSEMQQWEVVGFASVGEGGRVTFDGAPSGEPLQVIVEDPVNPKTNQWAALTLEPIEAGTHDAGIITARSGAVVTGQLVARGDLTLAERPALVLHRMATGDLVTVRPDDDGSFAFPAMPAGEIYAVTYHGPGYLHPAHACTIQGFTIGASAIGGVVDEDTHLRLMVQPTADGGPTPDFVGQPNHWPLTSVTGTPGVLRR